MVNLKIETTTDDNYSDDELTFFPYFTYFTNSIDPGQVCYVKYSCRSDDLQCFALSV
jgi:hypothetical protein